MLTKRAKETLPEYFVGRTSNGYEITYWPTHAVKINLVNPKNRQVVAAFNREDYEALIDAMEDAIAEVAAVATRMRSLV